MPELKSLEETTKTHAVSSSYKHWDKALLENARKSDEIERIKRKSD